MGTISATEIYGKSFFFYLLKKWYGLNRNLIWPRKFLPQKERKTMLIKKGRFKKKSKLKFILGISRETIKDFGSHHGIPTL